MDRKTQLKTERLLLTMMAFDEPDDSVESYSSVSLADIDWTKLKAILDIIIPAILKIIALLKK